MNQLDFLVNSYARLYTRCGIPERVLTPLRVIWRYATKFLLPRYLARPVSNKCTGSAGIIVSFTSFPTRIHIVWQVVECMLRQTCRPEKIILWLSKEQFQTPSDIPQSLHDREGEGFEIRLVEGDIRSHKKYFYVSEEFPDSLVFLIDDDIYYDSRLIERTIKAHEKHPDAVICNYGYHVGYDKDGCLKPYRQWKHEYGASEEDNLFFGSGGGTLFRPSEMYADLTNIECARLLCPDADDIWLNTMARKAGKRIVMLKNGPVLPVYCQNDVKLATQNLWASKNDEQLAAVINYYKRKE